MVFHRLIPLAFLLVGLCGPLVAAEADDSIVLHVAVDGDDARPGRSAKPTSDKSDGPLATLAGARDRIRAMKVAGSLTGPVTVTVHPGTYYLTEPLAFDPIDSGSPESLITFKSSEPGKAIISGGKPIQGWARSRETGPDGKSLWVRDLPEVKEGKWAFRELFIGGERRPRTRVPEEGFYTFESIVDRTGEVTWASGVETAGYFPGHLNPEWKHLDQAEIVALTRWIESRSPIASIDSASRQVTFANASTFRLENSGHGDKFAQYYVENVFDALKKPGQWFLDRNEGRLHYYPKPGETPNTLTAIAPFCPQIIRIVGTEAQPVRNIRFEDLTFRHAAFEYPAGDAGSVQAAFEVPGAVYLEHAQDCAFVGCTIEQVGTYGLETAKECKGIEVSHCTIQDLGAGGIKFNHGTSHGTVADCEVARGGRIYHSAIGVWVGNSGHNKVIHNHIHDFYYTGVSVGWTWGYSASNAVENDISYNHIHNIGQGLLSDMGAIYTLGISPGTRLAHNLIHDVSSYSYGGWGLYTDEGSSQIVLENNIVYRCKTGSFHQHYGKENIVRNNILANAVIEQIIRTREEDHKSFDFVNNVVYFEGGELLGSNWKNNQFFFDNNVYWNPDPAKINFKGETLEQWQARGHDKNSVIADPMFKNVGKDDFTLDPKSPAMALGFKPIDLSTVGPRKRE